MSKFILITKALEKNTDIIFMSPHENYVLEKSPRTDLAHIVNFYVAPKAGIYDISINMSIIKLQDFMMSLIPGLEPNKIDNFKIDELFRGDMIYFGKLWFDEEFGEGVTEIHLGDEDTFLIKELGNGHNIFRQKRKLLRRIFVRLYPNFQIANLCFSSQRDEISRKEFEKYNPELAKKLTNKKGIFAKIFGK